MRNCDLHGHAIVEATATVKGRTEELLDSIANLKEMCPQYMLEHIVGLLKPYNYDIEKIHGILL